ncbi:beta strand repeat-containing protein, partial [Komagataeibacter intermedius]|uniref:beta strand repeat-containing protein n=1 Tax=Komagataeibacter intermedius TaxID=66229 RepID=UPI00114771B7
MRHDSASTNMGHARGVVAACHHAAVWAAVLWGGGAYGQGLPAATTLPQGGIVVGNTATIGQPVVTGSTAALTVNQTADRAIINWSSFNVGSGASVNFVQPGTGAMVLNRVTGGETSAIAGKISANGTFILENPSGAILYNGAQVSAQSVIITPSHLSDSNFNSGILSFTAPTGSSVATPAVTVGQGATITAGDAGLVGLVAPQVSNAGTITANLGTILLAGGAKAYTIDLYGDGLINFQITDAVGAGEVASDALLVTNTSTGRLSAPRGSVQLTAQAADGVVKKLISAGGQISAPSTDQGNGEVSIEGIGGDITIAGNLLAQGSDSVSGGLVTVSATGGAVSTQAASRIDTTGYGTSSSVSIASDRAGTLAGTITTPGQVAIGGSSQVTSGGVIDAGSVDVIAGAMLALSGSGQLASAPQMVVDGTFDISGASSGITASALYGAGTVALGGQALTLTGATTGMEVPAGTGFDGSLTDGGLAGGTGGSLVLGGSATQILTGASTYTGPTVIGSGASLLLQGNGSITPSSTVVADGTFDISDMAATQVTALSGSGTVALGAGVLGVSNATGTFAGTLADGGTWGGAGGSLVVNGGTQTLTGQNTLTGGITVNNATLAISGDGALGFSPGGLTLSNGTLRTLAGMTLDHTITLAGSGGTIDTYGQDISFSNMISGSGGLIVTDSSAAGGGLLALYGMALQTGGTTVRGATLAVSDDAALGDSTGTLTLDDGGTLQTLAGLTSSRAITLAGTGGTIDTYGQASSLRGTISGSGGLVVTDSTTTGGGGLTLAGANTYTGSTTVAAPGLLALAGGGSIAPSDNVIVDGMLDIAGASGAVSLRSLAGSGQAVLGGNRLVLEQAGGTFSGVLSGTAGSLVVAAGSESLTGDNLYTGTTTLTPGATLQLGDGGSAGSVAGPVVNNGTLVLDHNADFTLGTAITG